MSELKPYHVLLFTLAALALLLGLVLIFPQDGIQLGKEANLKFVTYSELVDSNQVEYKDLTNILNDSALDAANLPVIYNAQIDHNFSDSLLFKPPQIGGYAETVKVEIGDLMQVSHPIQFPNGNKKVLHSFFKALKDNTELVRVIHYGDSQIEGDRITSFIRNQLQMQFGGSGLGMIPAVQAYNYDKSVTHRTSGNWRRYNVKEHAKFIKGRRFGAHLSFARFAPLTDIDESLFLQSDSLSMDTVFGEVPKEESSEKKAPITTDPESGRVYTGWLRFIANEKTYTTNREYKYCSIYYGQNQKPVNVEVFTNGKMTATKTLPPNSILSRVVFEVNSPAELELRFAGTDSPNFYGISFDNGIGVTVDNVPMRGAAGTTFTSMNTDFLRQMCTMMNAKLFIFQFGGNVTPYITSNYDYYEKSFSAQLEAYRRIAPDASILVIGPADMSRNSGGQYISYPNIPDIRDALRRAAFNNGAAFWDMYEAMGGKNSMPSWVNAKPQLATRDYTHFTNLGAEVVARMFYNALISEYNHYMSSGDAQK